MLTAFSMQNFRAFRSERIELRPVTVIIGANGLGKSSLFHPLLLLKQTLERTDTFITDDILLNGSIINFGQTTNIFHNWDSRSPLSISLDIAGTDFSAKIEAISTRTQRMARNYIQGLWREIRYIERDAGRRSKRAPKDLSFASNFIQRAQNTIFGSRPHHFEELITLLEQAELVISRAKVDSKAIEEALSFPSLTSRDAMRKQLLSSLRILRSLHKNEPLLADNILTLRFDAELRASKNKEPNLCISRMGIHAKGLSLFDLSLDEAGSIVDISSDIIDPVPEVATSNLRGQKVKSEHESIFRGLNIDYSGDYISEIFAAGFRQSSPP